MKNKIFSLYLAVWALLVALFNLFTFTIPATPINDKFTLSFWIGYALIMLTFVCQLVCAALALKDGNAQKTFYNIPLMRTSYVGLIISVVVGSICMLLSFIPYWLGAVICATIFIFNALALIKSDVVVSEVERVDKKIKIQTFFIKSLTIDAETLMAGAKDDDIKVECRKVAEALRYSDPMSNDALSSIEGAISIKFIEFSNAVQANDKEKAIPTAEELVVLIGDRNKKCKLLK